MHVPHALRELERGPQRASIPDDLAPDELTPAKAEELLAQPSGERVLGRHPETGRDILAKDGRYGPYVTEVLAEGEEGKPRTASLFSSMALETVTLDDALRLLTLPRTLIGGDGQEIVVANGRFFGGGLEICPEAETGDGLFDVLTIGDITKRDLVLTMPKIYRGTHLPHPKAELLRGVTVTITSDAPLPVELDGEQPGTTPLRLEVVPRALRLRIPRQTDALRDGD